MENSKDDTSISAEQESSTSPEEPNGKPPINPGVVTGGQPGKKLIGVVVLLGVLVCLLAAVLAYVLIVGDDKAVAPTSKTATSSQSSSFDEARDGFVKDFSQYQSFGGKYAMASQSVSYTVFLPSGFGFDKKNDRLQLSASLSGSGQAVVYDSGEKGNATCKDVSGGVQCVVTWKFNNLLKDGEYTVGFKVLDNATKQKGKIFVKIAGSQYGEGGGVVMIAQPLTTPYAELVGRGDTISVSKTSTKDVVLTVRLNSQYNATGASLALNGEAIDQTSQAEEKEASDFQGGKTSQFNLTLSEDDLAKLSTGIHLLSATVTIPGQDPVSVVTENGQASMKLVITD